jgi:hypothetical protein
MIMGAYIICTLLIVISLVSLIYFHYKDKKSESTK